MARSLHDDLNNEALFQEYGIGHYEYQCSEDGSKKACGTLILGVPEERSNKAQLNVGGDMRRNKDNESGCDEGGHLIGARFGGYPGEFNLFAQNQNFNRSQYKKLENSWENHVKAGDKVFVNIETSSGERPDAVMGYAIYESSDGNREYETFHFLNENQSMQEKWQDEIDTLEEDELPLDIDYTGDVENDNQIDSDIDTSYLGDISKDTFDFGVNTTEQVNCEVEGSEGGMQN